MQRLETAFHRTRPQRLPRTHRPSDALEVSGSEVLQLEQIAEKPPRAIGDDERIRRGDALQARRQIRRLAYDSAFLSLARAHDGHDPQPAGRHPDGPLEWALVAQLADCLDEC